MKMMMVMKMKMMMVMKMKMMMVMKMKMMMVMKMKMMMVMKMKMMMHHLGWKLAPRDKISINKKSLWVIDMQVLRVGVATWLKKKNLE